MPDSRVVLDIYIYVMHSSYIESLQTHRSNASSEELFTILPIRFAVRSIQLMD